MNSNPIKLTENCLSCRLDDSILLVQNPAKIASTTDKNIVLIQCNFSEYLYDNLKNGTTLEKLMEIKSQFPEESFQTMKQDLQKTVAILKENKLIREAESHEVNLHKFLSMKKRSQYKFSLEVIGFEQLIGNTQVVALNASAFTGTFVQTESAGAVVCTECF